MYLQYERCRQRTSQPWANHPAIFTAERESSNPVSRNAPLPHVQYTKIFAGERRPPNGGLPISAPSTEKVQKKMSVVPASGSKSATTHGDSKVAVLHSKSATQRDAAATGYPASGGKEGAREPCHLLVIFHQQTNHSFGVIRTPQGVWRGVAVGSRDRSTHVDRDTTPWLVRAGGSDAADFRHICLS